MAPRYIIGIDLGTTNSAVAYVDLREHSDDVGHAIHIFNIPQLTAPGEVDVRPVLPSFLYLPGAYDLPEGSTALPWDPDCSYAVGEMAREQGAKVPGRLVASAKSWLSHDGVDRTAHILPWGAAGDVSKVSPVEASTRYLKHIRDAWNARMAGGRSAYLLENQHVVLTVPASFDEVARELTVEAAERAGLPRVVLLEEPLAACYAWLHDHKDEWQDRMQDQDLILICDIGGGTTDFSIIGIQEGEDGLEFNRLAVGDHLMLGGDNMDLTLGRHVEQQLLGGPGKLDAQRWHQLVHQCRKAKETLLASTDSEAGADVTVLGTAGRLIGSTLKAELTQQEVRQLIIEGFYPEVGLDEVPVKSRRAGLSELGLPYVQDPAVTRHIAAFWRRSEAVIEDATGRSNPYPDFILFNGGTLTSQTLRDRIVGVVQGWFQPVAGADWAPIELKNPRLDLAVAKGAAYYGLVRSGKGIRIGSGSPRAYYVAVEAEQNTSDALPAVCLVPRGVEEGIEIRLDEPRFEALTNQPVAFQVYTSTSRVRDEPGDVVQLAPEEISVLPPVRTVLKYGKKGVARQLPVQITVHLTEIGTLELWCESEQSNHRWQLHFDVRQEADSDADNAGDRLPDEERFEAVRAELEHTFGPEADSKRHPPEQLRKRIETILELERSDWSGLLNRKLADLFLDVPRGRTADQEARWFNLLGYCLRPGFGDPLDAWRMKQVWKLFFDGLRNSRDVRCRIQWWIFWRRVAGGLPEDQQGQVYRKVQDLIFPGKGRRKSNITSQERLELWRALANFERLNPRVKSNLGRLLLQKFTRTRPSREDLWIMSRLGARIPMYGPLDDLVDRHEVGAWLKTLLGMPLDKDAHTARALVNMARYTGDRGRDVKEKLRNRVERWLDDLPEGDDLKELLRNPHHVQTHEAQDWVFGEALPVGLILSEEG